ncbi:sugar O-acetyltransferase [Vibrio sp. SS-MA-C1-2]|uniref:sugar O-acetyltransferase n=1 Tax=Vibrio sp. SS-MA-C1-2 TaxID=2908646 RepID=UPI001F3F913D|nr:sugar O-acetyltransferase [Vibrio sp. SS-MA-C1-2]UJF17665.1 sugar O-acetyltransferase [Vibrio sp. SS-MA-C1-2]
MNNQTEKEKMLAGLAYNAWDDELTQNRMRAKSICHQFNMADPTQLTERMKIVKSLLSFQGEAHMEPNFYCDYGFNIHVGNNFYSNHNLTILDVCEVKIGDNVLIGPHVMITTAGHPIDPIERQITEFGSPISIGNDVWIGGNVSILPGVSIGDNVVIGAGSVVNKDIPSDSVAVGNPCRVIKKISTTNNYTPNNWRC